MDISFFRVGYPCTAHTHMYRDIGLDLSHRPALLGSFVSLSSSDDDDEDLPFQFRETFPLLTLEGGTEETELTANFSG